MSRKRSAAVLTAVWLSLCSSHTGLASPIATLISDPRTVSVDLTRQTQDPNGPGTKTVDDPNSTTKTDGFQHLNELASLVQANTAGYSYQLQSAMAGSGYSPADPGIGGKFNAILLPVNQLLNMHSTGSSGGLQLQMSGTVLASATEQFSVATVTPWFWDANLTLTNNSDFTDGTYHFQLKQNSNNNVLSDDFSDVLNGTDHIRFGTLQPGSYTLTYSVTDNQFYPYTLAGTTQTNISGSAIFTLPEPGMLGMSCAAFAMGILPRRRQAQSLT